jgi:hypothetical protein
MLLMRNNKILILLAALLMLFIFVGVFETSSANETVGKKEVQQQNNPYANSEITIKIIPSIKKTFGYDILLQGKLFVHQPNIQTLPGHKGFTTKERAQKVAEFVAKKIRKNEMPPTVTSDDLNNMGVLK